MLEGDQGVVKKVGQKVSWLGIFFKSQKFSLGDSRFHSGLSLSYMYEFFSPHMCESVFPCMYEFSSHDCWFFSSYVQVSGDSAPLAGIKKKKKNCGYFLKI